MLQLKKEAFFVLRFIQLFLNPTKCQAAC